MRNVALAGFAGLLVVSVGLVSRTPKPHVRAAPVPDVPKTLLAPGPPSQAEMVRAQSFAATPGAIICPDFRTVSGTVALYAKASEEQSQDLLTHGQSRLLRGPAAPMPDLSSRGCVLVRPGTVLLLERGNLVPVVSARIGDEWVRGVTLSDMYMALEPASEAAARPPQIAPRYAQSSFWVPTSQTAEAVTGPAEFSTARLVLAGHAYPIALQRSLQPSELTKAVAVFKGAQLAAADALWFRVAIPENAPMLRDNSLCGHETAVWLLALISGDQRDALNLAFYSARQVPDLTPPALAEADHLCGTYEYTLAGNEASAGVALDAAVTTPPR